MTELVDQTQHFVVCSVLYSAVFIRNVDKQAYITEELLDIIPTKETLTERDVPF